MKKSYLMPVVVAIIVLVAVGVYFISSPRLAPGAPVGVFDCAPKVLDLDITITGPGNPNIPGLNVNTIDYDLKVDQDGGNYLPYGLADGDGDKHEGSFALTNQKNTLHLTGGRYFDFFLDVTPGTPGVPATQGPPPTPAIPAIPSTASISGAFGNALIGGTDSGLTNLPVSLSGITHSITFNLNGNKVTISWMCE